MASVYWIRLPEHDNILTQGYIGISNNAQTRFSDHKSCRANTHLTNAIKKYGWDNLVKEVILIADRLYCLIIESKLRPDIRLGWNTLPGGGMTPDNKGKTAWNKGKKLTAKQKENMFDIAEYMKSRTHGMLGRKHTQESIDKIKQSKKGTTTKELAGQAIKQHKEKIIG